MNYSWYGLNRTLCSVIEDARKAIGTLHAKNVSNVSPVLLSLIEEIQILGNRMEAALEDADDIENMHQEIKKLKKELRDLNIKIEEKKGAFNYESKK